MIAEKNLIETEPPKPGIPLKKSTLAVLGILVLALAFVTSMLMQPDSKPVGSIPQADKAAEPKTVGTSTAISEEEQKAKTESISPPPVVRSSATAQASSAAQLPPSSPIPPSVKRSENTSAFYEKSMASGSLQTKSGSAGGGGGLTPEQQQARVEAETQSRLAKSVVSDFTSDRQSSVTEAQATSGLPSLSQIQALTQGGVRAPSESLQPQIDAVMSAIKGGQTANESSKSWIKEYAQESKTGKVLTSYKASGPYMLHQGSVIPAVLGRQINSDLPGEIGAFTTVDVYDSLGKGQLLIPKGSRLVGAYDSEVKVGQSRILFAFERLILPNGVSFDLPAAKGSDLAGAAGLSGDVNNHFFKMFASSFLIAILADKTQKPTSVTNIGTSGPSDAAGQVLVDVSKGILERNRTIQPTITIEQGTRLNVQVVGDMQFPGAFRSPK